MSLSSRRGIYLSYTRLTLISGALAIFYLCSSSTRISLARSRGIVSLPDWPKQSSAPESHGGIGRPFPSWLHFEPQTQATTVQRPAGKRSSSTAATSTSSSTPSPSATSEDDLPPWTRSSTSENATESASTDCRGLPGASDTLVILKTGATEIYEKLPAHFVTTLRCSTDYLIFSDVEQDIGPFHVHDALAAVSADIKASHKDFELYRQLQQYRAEGQDAALLKGGSGWDLDKWKFVPMVVGAYRMRPEARWFVFIEADTFLSWANTLAWLRLLDAERPLYLGAQVMIGDTEFAHGGSGFVLSRAAARRLSERERERKEAWEERTLHECCGDKVLADALMEDGIKLTRSFPLIQGERVWSLDWSETHWCRAAVTWHHVRPSEVDAYWQFEQAWRANRVSLQLGLAPAPTPSVLRARERERASQLTATSPPPSSSQPRSCTATSTNTLCGRTSATRAAAGTTCPRTGRSRRPAPTGTMRRRPTRPSRPAAPRASCARTACSTCGSPATATWARWSRWGSRWT